MLAYCVKVGSNHVCLCRYFLKLYYLLHPRKKVLASSDKTGMIKKLLLMLCMILNFCISMTDYLNVHFFLKDLDKILSDTPPVWKGSSRLFRNLNEKGENSQQVNTCIYLCS